MRLRPVDDREPLEGLEKHDMMKFSPPVMVSMDYDGGTPRQVILRENRRKGGQNKKKKMKEVLSEGCICQQKNAAIRTGQ